MTYTVQHRGLTKGDWVPLQAEVVYETLDEVARLDPILREWFSSDTANGNKVSSVRVLDNSTGEVVFLSSTRELNRASRPF